jgi:hypothetical protein
MLSKIKKTLNLISNMGLRYVLFRILFLFKTKLGWQKIQFPTNPEFNKYIRFQDWKDNILPFFFYGKDIIGLEKKSDELLKSNLEDIKKGVYTFFNKSKIDLGTDYDWVTNPLTNYKYDVNKHWSEIQDLSKDAGDIKYVWEKARFSFLYDIIRYDYHLEDDQSEYVFDEIANFIKKNPINQGPNYKCSQEISLRILNWTFALYYYKDSSNLNEALFQKIMHSIYWQIHHVYHNINFSRIAVRNNHAITETLVLYLSGLLFPFIPEAKKWSKAGKKWFEQEIDYQIYKDGTFLQYSMNYHRVAIQLLTWGIRLSEIHKDKFSDVVYDKAKKSLEFLDASQDPVSKELPNYGSNDGALFFKLTDNDYRNYQSQLDDLRAVLFGTVREVAESQGWYGLENLKIDETRPEGVFSFLKSGYYIIQEDDVKTFIKCGAYKDRPAQADNLHLDIWVNGLNYLRDAGSYMYNTSKEDLDFFMGTKGHNTISVNGENQMLKGSRFIWYNWTKQAAANLTEKADSYFFEGEIKAFKHIGSYTHNRKVNKIHNQLSWEVIDRVMLKNEDFMEQYWHINPDLKDNIEITAINAQGEPVLAIKDAAWYSSYYGVKTPSLQLIFKDHTGILRTTIKIKRPF